MAEQRLPQGSAESTQSEEEHHATEDEEDDEDDEDRILEVYMRWQKLNQQVRGRRKEKVCNIVHLTTVLCNCHKAMHM